MSDLNTLDEAREWLRKKAVDKGAECPCCSQFTKVYKRKLTAATGRVLIAMHTSAPADGWVNFPDLRAGGDACKARYWGLIEPMPDVVREDGSHRVGWWRLTPRGTAFVVRQLRIPKYAHIYDGDLRGFDADEMVDIGDVLGTRFRYDDLMAGQ